MMTFRWLFALACAGLLFPFASRATTPDPPSLVFVLIDTSLSTPAVMDSYRRAWVQIRELIRGGDRLILALAEGRVDATEASVLRAVVDREVPTYSMLRDNPVTYDAKLTAIRNELTKEIERLFAEPRGRRSELIRSVRDAGRILASEKRRPRVLIILSDLLEDSADYRFASMRLTDAVTESVIARNRATGLPTLANVSVFTVLPGTTAPAKADEVERFWTRFLRAAGASLPTHNYGTLAAFRQ